MNSLLVPQLRNRAANLPNQLHTQPSLAVRFDHSKRRLARAAAAESGIQLKSGTKRVQQTSGGSFQKPAFHRMSPRLHCGP